MIKASALLPVGEIEESKYALCNKSINFNINTASDGEDEPEYIRDLANQLMIYNDVLKKPIAELRSAYERKSEGFRISLDGRDDEEVEIIRKCFHDMLGIVQMLFFSDEEKVLYGKLVYSAEAKKFILGGFLEIALFDVAKKILNKIKETHNIKYHLYKNVRVEKKNKMLLNEFDLLIEVGTKLYVIEIKSGNENSINLENYRKIFQTYTIDNFMLVSNSISSKQMNTTAHFCNYRVANLELFESELIRMIEEDM